MKETLLLLTPPLLQTNTPYPATMHLTGFLERAGYDVHQRDLSIKVVRDVLLTYGDETTDELLEFLSGPAPLEAKREASEIIDDLARAIRDEIDPDFGFSRYAEHLCQAVEDFGVLERKVKKRGVMDEPLERHLREAMEETHPTIIGVTCPFPGTLIGAFKIARYVKCHYPNVRLVLGGGYVSTELREMTDPRPYKYFDVFQFDEGYEPMLRMLDPKVKNVQVPVFVRPSYRGIDWDEYFDVVETDNFVTNLWNSGRWVKLIMARGCYWHKCAFCDVKLPYIGCFEMPKAAEIVDAMEALGSRFHFVDEAMPPALVRGVCEEILRRGFVCEWWGNVRFDAAFTPELTKLMAKAGCIAVTGGLECANDRLLELMNKGITLASAEKVLRAFKAAHIFVHAYLMYDFPTETKAEQRGAEKYVKELGRKGLIQSCFWHRFALTVHSPIAKEPERFGIVVTPPARRKNVFARNELAYEYAPVRERRVECLGFSDQKLALSRMGWLQARYYADDASDTVRDFLSYDAVFDVNPYEVGASHRAARRAFAARMKVVRELIALDDLLPRAFVSLSNGETRRVLLARAILKDPEELILEDPFNGLDPEQCAALEKTIAVLRERGMTVMLSGAKPRRFPKAATVRRAKTRTKEAPIVIEFKSATVRLGRRKLFKGFSWTVREGERWVLRGRNGSGKTTLMALITGDSPLGYALDLTVFGQRRDTGCDLNELRAKIAMVSPEMQAYRNETAEELLEEALKRRPKLLILDEPCMNLSGAATKKLLSRVSDYLKAHPKTTAICIAHRPDHIPSDFTHVLDLDTSAR